MHTIALVKLTQKLGTLSHGDLSTRAETRAQRRGKRHDGDVRDDLEVYEWHGRYVPLVEGYKSLRCFFYQCNEGGVCEQPLYRALDAYADRLAVKVAEASPASRAAAWT